MALGALERGDQALQPHHEEVYLKSMGQKVISFTVTQKKLDHGRSRVGNSNERMNSPSATLQAKSNTSPAKHPVDYKRVDRRIKWSVSTPVYFEKESKSKSSNNSTRTGGPVAVQVPVKMRLQPKNYITGQSTCN